MRDTGIQPKHAQGDPYILRSRKQLATLKAAARQELLDVLSSMGKVSVAELAAALGKPADSLYYHLRILQKAGLVVEDGTHQEAGHSERLYRAVASDLRLAYTPGLKGNAEAVTPIVDSMLRLTSRDFKAAFENGTTVVEGPQRELWAARTTGRLTEQQVEELNRHLASMRQITVSSPPRDGGERLYALTMVLTPLNR
jgi:DNA-binding transcriptional ArsR family regulator